MIETEDNQVEVKRGRQARNRGASQEANQHIGERIRIRRTLLNLSQPELGKALGMSFQQMRKYETGASSVGAGQLCEIAKALDVPVSFFYDGLDGISAPAEPEVKERQDERFTHDELEVLTHYKAAPGFIQDAVRTLLGYISGQDRETGGTFRTPDPVATPVSRPRGRPRKNAKAPDAAPPRESSSAGEASNEADAAGESGTAETGRKTRRRTYGATWSPLDIRK